MSVRLSRVVSAVLAVGGLVSSMAACGSNARSGFTDDKKTDTNPTDPSQDGGAIFGGPDAGPEECTDLSCKQVKCDDPSTTTTLTGKVYDPGGRVPLYNVMVYVPSGDPNAELPKQAQGVQCETCASTVVNPLVSTSTDTSGSFVLKNVPVGDKIPLVMQIGKWRRKIFVDVSNKCAENKLPKADAHLPRSGDEGDMPHIAVTTGDLDSLECLFVGMGVDSAEFVAGGDMSGHIHMFDGDISESSWPSAQDNLWNDVDQLKKYDMTLLSCEGSEYKQNKGGDAPTARGAMKDYLDMGGRVFATHFHYIWFKQSPDPDFRQLATWGSATITSGAPGKIVTSFPKGSALSDWLVSIGASSKPGELTLTNMTSSVQDVGLSAQSWIEMDGTIKDASGSTRNISVPKYFSFNTPLKAEPAKQCGRGVFSDLHMFGGHKELTACGNLNAQQKALEFMFFNLASCVQDDKTPPGEVH